MPRQMNHLVHAVLWPRARITHPNFHGILLGMVLVHYLLGVSSFLGNHETALWYYFGGAPGLCSLGVAHLAIATSLTAGVYRRWAWVRRAMLASVAIYLLKFSLFFAAVARSFEIPNMLNLSFEVPIFNVGLILLSIAAYQQPAVPHETRGLT